MALKLTNTLTGQKEDFVPNDQNRVTMYVCGPTVYWYAHIGNARPAVVYDVLYRYLKATYPKVVYARNITDVDDKINKAAREQGVGISVITEKFTQIYHEDMAALGVLSPDIEPKVTDHITHIIHDITALLKAGNAYEAEGHVLFHVPSFARYGQLSRRDRDEMIAGARVDVAPYKKDPADFVLWKPSDTETPGWDSPWGRGRPGWHIECTAMINAALGTPVDIHGGGQDLIFPHHENELAQGECCSGGKTYAKYWVHNGFVNIEGEKMAKSEGNILLVHDLIKDYPGEVIRFALLSAHYRQPLDWSSARLKDAKRTLDGFYRILLNLKTESLTPDEFAVPDGVKKALEDDLNVPKAIAALHQLARTVAVSADRKALKAQMLGAGRMLGLLQSDPEEWFKTQPHQTIDESQIDSLMTQRDAARAAKDFARSDEIRDELLALGIMVEDSKDGSRWRVL